MKTWKNVEDLKQIGVTHIVNLRFSQDSQKVKQFKWLWLPFHDDLQPGLAGFTSAPGSSTKRHDESGKLKCS
jgi:hypothetical protein